MTPNKPPGKTVNWQLHTALFPIMHLQLCDSNTKSYAIKLFSSGLLVFLYFLQQSIPGACYTYSSGAWTKKLQLACKQLSEAERTKISGYMNTMKCMKVSTTWMRLCLVPFLKYLHLSMTIVEMYASYQGRLHITPSLYALNATLKLMYAQRKGNQDLKWKWETFVKISQRALFRQCPTHSIYSTKCKIYALAWQSP